MPLSLFPLLLLLLLPPASEALVVDGLYSHRVAVADQSDAERSRAFTEAFSAVILKVAGQDRWLVHPTIADARQRAESFIEAIAYTDEQDYIEVSFAEQLINDLLREAGIPLWGSNRPSVLVWMVLQDANGERNLLTIDSNPEAIELIQTIAAERALPVIFPLLDFEDLRNLPMNVLWNLEEEPLRVASQRYGADSILAGRLLETPSGELAGLWQFIFQDSVTLFDGLDTELDAYFHTSLSRISNQLAAHFAVLHREVSLHSVRLRVDGIDDLESYAALLAYLRELGLMDSISIAALNGERVELRLSLEAETQQLTGLIALDRDLLPVNSSANSTETDLLHYRWTR